MIAVLGALLLCACAARPPIEQEMRAATEAFNCPAEKVDLKVFAGDTRIASGCNHEAWFTCVKIIDAGRWDNQCFQMQDLKKRALFELGCSDAATNSVQALDELGHVAGVKACGKQGSYQYVRVGRGYDWVTMTTPQQ